MTLDERSSLQPDAAATLSLHIPKARPAWGLLFQSGAFVACTVGVTLHALLREGFGLSEEELVPIDVFLLEGAPVDFPETAVVPNEARLALAAGLPGIAGLAMKKGSAVGALRAGITHTRNASTAPSPGGVNLFLYSLALPLLAGRFLQRGVVIDAARFVQYSRFAPNDPCILNARSLTALEAAAILSTRSATTKIFLQADLVDDTDARTAQLCRR